MRAPPESLRPMTGAPIFIARSITLQIFSAYARRERAAEHREVLREDERPCDRRRGPSPVTTPSPRILFLSMSKSVQRCVTKRSSSTNDPGSSSRSTRSRAVSLPASCCFAMRAAPPPSSARRFISSSRARPATVPVEVGGRESFWAMSRALLPRPGARPKAPNAQIRLISEVCRRDAVQQEAS